MQTEEFKKPAKWIEVLMLYILPAICFVVLCFSVYFQVFTYHPANYNAYEIQTKR